MGKVQVVTCQAVAEKVVQTVMMGQTVVGLACTGVCVGPRGQLSLVVVSTAEGDALVFDVKKNSDIMYRGLGRLLQSAHVLKVVHDSGPVTANLQNQFGIFLTNVFDTQVAYSVMLETQGLCPRRVPLSALCDKCGLSLSSTPSLSFQRLLHDDVNAWSRRPLNHDMVNSAVTLALPLVPSLYQHMLKEVKGDNWAWFCALNNKARLSLIQPRPRHAARVGSPAAVRGRMAAPKTKSSVAESLCHLTPSQRQLIKGSIPPAAISG